MVNEFWKNLQGSPPINSFYLTRIIYFWIVGGFFSNQLDKRVVAHEDTSHSRFSLPDYSSVGGGTDERDTSENNCPALFTAFL